MSNRLAHATMNRTEGDIDTLSQRGDAELLRRAAEERAGPAPLGQPGTSYARRSSTGSNGRTTDADGSAAIEELIVVTGLLEVTLAGLLGSGLLNAQGPRSASQNEGLQKLPRLDSNQ